MGKLKIVLLVIIIAKISFSIIEHNNAILIAHNIIQLAIKVFPNIVWAVKTLAIHAVYLFYYTQYFIFIIIIFLINSAGSVTTCTSCNLGYYYLNNKCYDKCPSGYYKYRQFCAEITTLTMIIGIPIGCFIIIGFLCWGFKFKGFNRCIQKRNLQRALQLAKY